MRKRYRGGLRTQQSEDDVQMTAHPRPTAVLTDDHPAVLAAVCRILQRDFEIVATAGNGMQAFEAVTLLQPELLVLDITMPGWSGFETAERVLQISPATKVLFLTIYEDIDFMEKAREMGASYVLKRRMRHDLLSAALRTSKGELFFSDLSHKA
jgi:DNA-binding NarL/FixJ family response regulator